MIRAGPGEWLTAAVVAVHTPLRHDPGEVRDLARDLLSRPPYRAEAQGPLATIAAWLRRQLAELVSTVLGTLQASTAVGWFVAAAAAALLAVAVWSWTRGVTVDRSLATTAVAPSSRTVADWLADAAEHERAGRWREALRCGYSALVVALADASVVEDVPGRTPRELVGDIEPVAPMLAATVAGVARRFDEVWYGSLPATPDDLAAARDAVAAAGATRPRVLQAGGGSAGGP